MSLPALRIALALAAAAMAAFAVARLDFGTDVTNFLPESRSDERAALSRLLSDTRLSRTQILTVGGPDEASALAAAGELADRLRRNPAVDWVRDGVDPELPRHVYELYFPRRLLFLSDHPERDIPQRLSESALRADAARLRRMLAMPTGTLLERVAPADPLGAFAHILETFSRARAGLRTSGGHLVSDDGHAVLFLATRASGFDAAVQRTFERDLERDFAELDARHGGALTLERAGVARYVVDAERAIRGDVLLIALVSFLGVGALFMLFLRSPSRFGLAVLPGVFGILVATTAGILVFGDLGGITLAFGTSLLGVAIDYPIHLLNHHSLSPARESAWTVARRLRTSLGLGAATTMASFAGLALTRFPSFREMAFFSVVGVATAACFTLGVLPALVGEARPVPPLAAGLARRLGALVRGLERRRAALAAVPLALLALCAASLPRLHWNDRIAALSEANPQLAAEDARVRERVSQWDAGRFVIALGDDAEQTLAANDRVHAALSDAIAAGELEATRSLHDLLWSASLQRRNWEVLKAQGDVAGRVREAFAREGFRPEAFAPFAEALAGPAPEPLDWATLRASPLGELADALTIDVGDGIAALTLLRGVTSADALRRRVKRIPGAVYFDQGAFVDEIYAAFRATTLTQMAVGSILVVGVLGLRYRRLRPALAAFLPSLLVAGVVLAGFALAGAQVNLLHVMSLLMVMGMGVDYGIFVVDSSDSMRDFGATMLSLLISCLTTLFVFGTLALSSQPALRAIGLTTGLGILLSFLLAPLVFVVAGARVGRS